MTHTGSLSGDTQTTSRECVTPSRRDIYDAPVGDPRFDSLPFDERRRVAIRLRILRATEGTTNASDAMRLLVAANDGERGLTLKRMLNLRTLWRAGNELYPPRDWQLLVNRSAAGVNWRGDRSKIGLPAEFTQAVRELFVENKRKMRPAFRKLADWWQTGIRRRGVQGRREPMPGYGFRDEWLARGGVETLHGLPHGWSYDNLRRRCGLSNLERTLAHVGVAAASGLGPVVLGTRAQARFLERVFFDDVKVDFRVFDPASEQVVDLWLLVAMDYATAAFLGFWMRPATTDYKGREEHLRHQDMIHFAGWLLETYGLPAGYRCEWKVENGTATFTEACAEALGGLFGDRLTVSYARMIGGKSGAGYQESAGGNSRAKAPLESAFNLLHNEAADMPGQTGRRYDVRPADLVSREKETLGIMRVATEEPEDVRSLMRLPLLTLAQSRIVLNHIFLRINTRTEHDLEGFPEVLDWREFNGIWQPIATLPNPQPFGCQIRQRKQSPLERLTQLRSGAAWEAVPQSALALFYGSTQRFVEVNDAGEIAFSVDKQVLTFRPPDGVHQLPTGTKLLAFYCPQDPQFVHLTRRAPHRGYVCTWTRRVRVALGDRAGVTREIEYAATALKAARTVVADLQADERLQLDDMRAHNAEVLAEADARRNAIDATAPTAEPARIEDVTATTAALVTATQVVKSAPAKKQSDQAKRDEAFKILSKHL